ncbi:FAD-dependent monooxygenase [Streptomyces sp. NPDC091272]|uniref:FAD-dependent monooxygenase n=1 Tax=Streptomyces sp. NPDC091272 TaxID=3365981 RepID=UPI0038151CBA
MTDVLIVGSGPTGLTLACALARHGADVRIVDKSPDFPRSSRAKGPNPRSLEVLEDLGVVGEVLAAGCAPLPMRKYRDGVAVADTDPYETLRPTPAAPYDRGRLLPQWRLEEILRTRLAGYGVHVELGTEIVSYEQHDDRVLARTAGGALVEARYLVGCDGGRSTVRKLMGVTFEGVTHETQLMVNGDVQLERTSQEVPDDVPPRSTGARAVQSAEPLARDRWHQWFDEDGAVLLCPIPGTDDRWWFQAGPEFDADGDPVPPSRESFQRLFDRHARVPGLRLTDAALLTTYRVNVRMADRFRDGRVLLAGDAAHVHPIAGGLGMNTGIQDAFNLGWKLGAVLSGQAGEGLLGTYEEERLPVAVWTLDASSARLDAVMEAIKLPGGGLDAGMTEETNALGPGYRWSSLAVRGTGTSSTLHAGDRAPDAPCVDTATGAPLRLFEAFAGPHFTLLGFGEEGAASLKEVADQAAGTVRAFAVDAGPHGGLRDEGGHARTAYGVEGDALVLVRPDNHVSMITGADGRNAVLDHLRTLGRGRE